MLPRGMRHLRGQDVDGPRRSWTQFTSPLDAEFLDVEGALSASLSPAAALSRIAADDMMRAGECRLRGRIPKLVLSVL